MEALSERGLDSKGALAAGAARADGKAVLAEVLGLEGETAAARDARWRRSPTRR